jgi:TonB family protein
MRQILSPVAYALLLFSLVCGAPLASTRPQAAQTPANVQQQASWETYTFNGEEFSVALPEMPALDHTSRNVLGEVPTETARNYGAYGNDIVYLIRAYDKPRDGEDLNYFAKYYARSLLSGDRERSIQIRGERELPLGKFSGRQYVIVRDSKPMSLPTSSIYVFLTRQHAYAMRAVGGDDNHPDVQRFLTSFTLTDKPTGRQIVDESKLPQLKVKRAGAATSTPDQKKQSSGEQKSKGTDPKTGGGESGGNEGAEQTITAAPPIGAADANQIYNAKEATNKVVVVYKPEPAYTEEARKNQVTGTVRLRLVLSASGKVTDIVALTLLPNGLTEQAARAASHIKFIPAMKDGRRVAQYVTIEYNFNIY